MARLFFALWPGPETRDSLLKIRDTLPADCGRLISANNLHITLVFLGEVNAEKAECVMDRARQLSIKPVTLILDNIGWWNKTQVVWLAPAHIPEEIPIFVAELAAASTRCSVRLDQRPYRPHVTLARGVRRKPVLIRLYRSSGRSGGFHLFNHKPFRADPAIKKSGHLHENV